MPASDAARQLGMSLDTLCGGGTGRAVSAPSATAGTGASSRRPRSTGCAAALEKHDLSARNRFRGRIREVRIEGLLAQVELDVHEPTRVVAVINREAAEQLGLAAGQDATALVKATSVMVGALRRLAWLLMILALLAASCGGGGDDETAEERRRLREAPRLCGRLPHRSLPGDRLRRDGSTSPARTSSPPRSGRARRPTSMRPPAPSIPDELSTKDQSTGADLRHQPTPF